MLTKKWFLAPINVLVPMMLLAVQAHGAETGSEAKRIEELDVPSPNLAGSCQVKKRGCARP